MTDKFLKNCTAEMTARVEMDQYIFFEYCIPVMVITDQGPHFKKPTIERYLFTDIVLLYQKYGLSPTNKRMVERFIDTFIAHMRPDFEITKNT